jgi:hypothetical protein
MTTISVADVASLNTDIPNKTQLVVSFGKVRTKAPSTDPQAKGKRKASLQVSHTLNPVSVVSGQDVDVSDEALSVNKVFYSHVVYPDGHDGPAFNMQVKNYRDWLVSFGVDETLLDMVDVNTAEDEASGLTYVDLAPMGQLLEGKTAICEANVWVAGDGKKIYSTYELKPYDIE